MVEQRINGNGGSSMPEEMRSIVEQVTDELRSGSIGRGWQTVRVPLLAALEIMEVKAGRRAGRASKGDVNQMLGLERSWTRPASNRMPFRRETFASK